MKRFRPTRLHFHTETFFFATHLEVFHNYVDLIMTSTKVLLFFIVFRFDFEMRATLSFGVLYEVRLGLSEMIKGFRDQLVGKIFVFKYLSD